MSGIEQDFTKLQNKWRNKAAATTDLTGTAATNIRKGQRVRVLKQSKSFTTIGLQFASWIAIAAHDAKKGEKLTVLISENYFRKH